MTITAGARVDLRAHQDSIRLTPAELVTQLRDLLGAKLVAYVGSQRETRAVRLWAEGDRTPHSETLSRLRATYHAAALLAEKDAPAVVQAWFVGANPRLGDVAPARLLREGVLDQVAPEVLAAARAFGAES